MQQFYYLTPRNGKLFVMGNHALLQTQPLRDSLPRARVYENLIEADRIFYRVCKGNFRFWWVDSPVRILNSTS